MKASESGEGRNIEHRDIERDLDDLFHPAKPADFDHEEPAWTEILPGLFQGGTHDADILGANDAKVNPIITKKAFDTVITMYQWANPVDWFVRELRYCIYDWDLEHFPYAELFDVVRLAHADWKRGQRVLIRCQAGLNRSGLITALVLIREGYTAEEAIRLQRAKRGNWVLFNQEFVQFLLDLDPTDWRGDSFPEPLQNPVAERKSA